MTRPSRDYLKVLAAMAAAIALGIGAGWLVAATTDSALAGIAVGGCVLYAGALLVAQGVELEGVGPAEREAHRKRLPLMLAGATILLAAPIAGLTDAVPPLARFALAAGGLGIILVARHLYPSPSA